MQPFHLAGCASFADAVGDDGLEVGPTGRNSVGVGVRVGAVAGGGDGIAVVVLIPSAVVPCEQGPVFSVGVDHVEAGRFPAPEQLAVGIGEGHAVANVVASIAVGRADGLGSDVLHRLCLSFGASLHV